MSGNNCILEPGQIEAPAVQIQYLYLANKDLFERRSQRFMILAVDHPLGDYLAFLGLLAGAQQMALSLYPSLPLPDPEEQAVCRDYCMPLLSARSWTRTPAWLEGFARILEHMRKSSLPSSTYETIDGLMQMNKNELEEMADRILEGNLAGISPSVMPFVAAALQVYWVNMTLSLGDFAFGRLESEGVCPVCGSYPSAGIIHCGRGKQGLRYLCCSLCASQWHMVRIKCSSCESTEGIVHYTLGGSNGSVKAESCDKCHSYLKLLYLEKDSQMEAMADDMATLALDIMMNNDGKLRNGPNLYFHPGSI